jgi:hypothetical protein
MMTCALLPLREKVALASGEGRMRGSAAAIFVGEARHRPLIRRCFATTPSPARGEGAPVALARV